MKIRLLSVIFVIFIFFLSSFVSVTSVNFKIKEDKSSFIEEAELPTWAIGNFWKYYMNFVFTSKDQGSVKFSIDAEVDDMYTTVISIENYGNDVVSKMVSRRQIRVPKEVPPEVRCLSKETVHYIHEMTHTMDDWKGVVARFITLAYPYTGLRPSELRTMKYKDVDMDSWTLRVSHPKGDGIYGKKRRMGIRRK